jgi:histone H3/H4
MADTEPQQMADTEQVPASAGFRAVPAKKSRKQPITRFEPSNTAPCPGMTKSARKLWGEIKQRVLSEFQKEFTAAALERRTVMKKAASGKTHRHTEETIHTLSNLDVRRIAHQFMASMKPLDLADATGMRPLRARPVQGGLTKGDIKRALETVCPYYAQDAVDKLHKSAMQAISAVSTHAAALTKSAKTVTDEHVIKAFGRLSGGQLLVAFKRTKKKRGKKSAAGQTAAEQEPVAGQQMDEDADQGPEDEEPADQAAEQQMDEDADQEPADGQQMDEEPADEQQMDDEPAN